jgi:hypothetical protein
MEPTASRRTIERYMTSTVNPQRRAPSLATAHLVLVKPELRSSPPLAFRRLG